MLIMRDTDQKIHNQILHMYVLTQPLSTTRIWHKVNFWEIFNKFEFNFLILREELKLKSPVCPTICP